LYNVAFSGDMKYEKTWLFNPATTKFPRLETIFIESTYGGHHDMQPSRQEASDKIQAILSTVLERGGRVIVPVFAVGRSQEVMVVLEQYMRLGKIPKVPIYLDGMIYEATAIHTAYPEFLNTQLRTQIFQNGQNPFLSEVFKRIDSHEMREKVCESVDPCIALATSGMMNGGPVLEYVKSWGSDEKSALVFVGFQAEGTMGRRIQRGMREISLQERGRTVKVELKLETITCDGFSGHSDRAQLMSYVAALDPRPERIIVGHGEESKCIELASALYKKYGLETRAPANLETIRLR
jgi:predicted metal-dependent RNase